MKCPVCGGKTECIDYPTQGEYHKEDCEWGIWPDRDDPGWLVAKSGARPISAGCNK
jgi:hypothetical protein